MKKRYLRLVSQVMSLMLLVLLTVNAVEAQITWTAIPVSNWNEIQTKLDAQLPGHYSFTAPSGTGAPSGAGDISGSDNTTLKIKDGYYVKISGFAPSENNVVITKSGGGQLIFEANYDLRGATGTAHTGTGFIAGEGVTLIQRNASAPQSSVTITVGTMEVGEDNKRAYLNILDGGQLVVKDGMTIGFGDNSRGEVLVSGDGSTLNLSGNTAGTADVDAVGNLTVRDNGQVILGVSGDATTDNVLNFRGTALFESGGVLRGVGTLNGQNGTFSDVVFEKGSILTPKAKIAFEDTDLIMNKGSRYDVDIDEGTKVTVTNGDAYINNALLSVKPIQDAQSGQYKNFTDVEILTADHVYGNYFVARNPYIDIISVNTGTGGVEISGTPRDTVNPLSDMKATSLLALWTEQWRTVFRQMHFEEPCGYADVAYNNPNISSDSLMRAQSRGNTCQWAAWFEALGRWNDFDSTYIGYGDKHGLESFGAVLGFEQVIAPYTIFGVMGGYDHPILRNRDSYISEEIRINDGFFGMYGGHRFHNKIELKAWIGGGFQSYDMRRHEDTHYYTGKGKGESFVASLEGARPYRLGWTVLRPTLGLDYSYVNQRPFTEKDENYEYGWNDFSRSYERASLSRLYGRIGLRAETLGEEWRFRGSLFYSGLLSGDTSPEATFRYNDTAIGGSAISRGADIGRSVLNLDLGLKWSPSCYNGVHTVYIDFTGDFYLDREGSPLQRTLQLGYIQRF